MKKFFSIILTAALALVSVPSCGGGGDSHPTKITATEFARGAKYFMFANGLAGTLFVCPDKNFPSYDPQVTATYPSGATLQETSSAVDGSIGIGAKGKTRAIFEYVCEYDEKGVPVKAILTISTWDNSADDDTLVNFFNEATPEDGEEVVDLRGAPTIEINFISNQFTMTARAGIDNEPVDPDNPVVDEEDDRTIGGQVIVQFQ